MLAEPAQFRAEKGRRAMSQPPTPQQIAVLYGTNEGQTAHVAQMMSEVLDADGHTVFTAHIKRLPPSFDALAYDLVLIGASLHEGQYQDYVVAFLTAHAQALTRVPSALFTLCLSAASTDPEKRAALQHTEDALLAATDWQPRHTARFGGALRYSQFGFLERRLVRSKIQRAGHASTNIDRDYDYTDWDAVADFARSMVVLAASDA